MSFVALCTLLLVIVTLAYLYLRQHFAYWERWQVLHEQPTLIWGNMKGLGKHLHFRDVNKRIYEKFKDKARFVGMYILFTRAVFVMDLDLIKTILIKDFTSIADRGLFHNVRDDPLTGNLLFVDGAQWRELRYKLSPVFTTGKIRYMFPTMVTVAERLVNTCGEIVTNAAGIIEAKDLCARYTTDVIGVCAFGLECNSLKDPNSEFRSMGRDVFEKPRHSFVVQTFMFNDPVLARKLRLKNFTDEATEFFMNAVRETVRYREEDRSRKRQDFMDLLIELKAKRDGLGDAANDTDDMSNGLTIEQVAAQAMMFFLAGFDTSSTTMSFCLYELALNQDVQEKLRQEILEVLQTHNNVLSYESVQEMSYLNKVISETLRKYSVIPHLARQTTSKYKIPGSHVTLPIGTRIIIPIAAIHHDPAYYPEPETFDPERFAPDAVLARPACTYLPFGDGPRNCIGLRFGRLQAFIGIVTLLRHYRFRTTPATQIPMRYSLKSFLLAPESGIELSVEKL